MEDKRVFARLGNACGSKPQCDRLERLRRHPTYPRLRMRDDGGQ